VCRSSTFHARYSALARRYDYWIINDPVRAPLAQDRADGFPATRCGGDATRGHVAHRNPRLLVISLRGVQAKSPVRELRQFTVERRGRLIRVRAVANAFLHHMVRNLVGALVYVGTGRNDASWVAEVLAARDRTRGAPTFSAAGLYLTHVEYDPALELPPADENPPFLA